MSGQSTDRIERDVLALILAALGACSAPVSDADVAQARDRLRPAFTQVEVGDYIEGCLTDKAITAFARLPDLGFEGANVSHSDIQGLEDCKAAVYEGFPSPPEPKTPAERQVMYELYVLEAACLAEEGHPVDVPSLDRYIDENGTWTPYSGIGPGPDWGRLNESCPQDPWSYEP